METPQWMSQWQTAYPYITQGKTGISLGDYSDSKKKFLKAWAKANPHSGSTDPFGGFSQAEAEQMGFANNQMRQDQGSLDEYNQKGQSEWYGSLTPAQQAEWQTLAHNKYKSQNRMSQMAFLAAAGAMAAPGILGGLGSMGEGVGATGLGGLEAADIAGGLVPEFGTSAAYSAIPGLEGMAGGSLAGSGGSMWNSIPDFLKSLGTSTAKNVGGNWLSQLISAGTNAYMGNKQAGQYNDVINQINQLYSPDSAYAKQMQQSLARKDAAAGRNSQYGSRAVELAAALTQAKSNALTSPGYGNLMGQRGINQNVPWNGFLAAMGSGAGQDLITKAGGGFGSWLSGLFGNSGDKYSPTAPNASGPPNWWNQVYSDGGP